MIQQLLKDFDVQSLEDHSIQGNIIGYDIDGLNDGSLLIATVDSPKQCTAKIDSFSGEWSYIPDLNYFGTDDFAVTITDDLGGTTKEIIAVSISPVDDEIVILPSSITEATIKEGSSTAGQINATDVDGLTNPSIYKIINGHQPAHGTATVDPTRGIWITLHSSPMKGKTDSK